MPLPAHQRHSATSHAAAAAIAPDTATLRDAVFSFLKRRGASGSTDEETGEALAMGGNTVRPRRRELQQAGLVIDSGATRLTRSGRKAVVWVVVMPTV